MKSNVSRNNNKIILYPSVINARFKYRLNRFVSIVSLNGEEIKVHLPTTGRLTELLVPDAEVFIAPADNINRNTSYSLVAVYRKGEISVVDSHITNKIFQKLFKEISLFKNWKIDKAEFTFGKTRFDFLISKGEQKGIVEVKSCTLLENGIASFPDAKSERAVKHIHSLREARDLGYASFLVFLITGKAKHFIPNYFQDEVFFNTFLDNYHKIKIIALSYSVELKNNSLCVYKDLPEVPVPYDVLSSIELNRGSYLVVFKLIQEEQIHVGGFGNLFFPSGYYIYTGSALNNLSKRIERHKKNNSKKKWHVDYLHPPMKFVREYHFSSMDVECELAEILSSIFSSIKQFGSSDCKCRSHLFYSKSDPEFIPDFINIIFKMRFNNRY